MNSSRHTLDDARPTTTTASATANGGKAQADSARRNRFNFFSRDVWARFGAIATPYWREDEKAKAWGFIIVLIVMLLAETQIAVLLNEQAGEMTSALAAKDKDRFWHAIMYCLIVVAVNTYAHGANGSRPSACSTSTASPLMPRRKSTESRCR